MDDAGEVYIFPLSCAQQRLWILARLGLGSPVDHVTMGARLRGRLDIDALRAAVGGVVARHEALRTTFEEQESGPVQVVAASRAIEVPVVDLGGIAPAEREAEALARAAAVARRPFDLARGPLVRAEVLRLGPEEHVLVVAMHHLIADGWSLGVLARELAALYAAHLEGRPAALPEPPIQLGDYAEWERARLGAERLREVLAIWKRRLAGAPPLLALPTDRPRPPVQRFRGAARSALLSPALERGLTAVAGAEGCTPAMALLAAFAALLHRWSGQDDLVIGTVVANRDRPETAGLIGFLVSTLAIRVDLSGAPSFRELLRRVRGAALEAYANQDLPFERLVQELAIERSTGHAPVFQAMFIHEDARPPELELPGLAAEPLGLASGSVPVDLLLTVGRTGAGLAAALAYDLDLFHAPTIERMLGHLERLIARVIVDPRLPVGSADLLSDAEREEILRSGRGAPVRAAPEAGLHALIAAQAARTPRAAAVLHGDEALTYAALVARARRLARRLRALGVRPEVRVAHCADRSFDRIVGALAILEAGGAFVPLDPAHPAERLEAAARDARAPVIVARGPGVGAAVARAIGAALLDLDAEPSVGEDDREEDEAPPAVPASPEQLAYVIFTSGSTGRPKGVMLTHGGITRRLRWATQEYPLSAEDRLLHLASPSFDVSVWELFVPLVQGATLVLPAPGVDTRDPAAIAAEIEARRVTVIGVVPSLLQALIEAGGAERLASLRYVFAGAERLTREVQRLHAERLGGAVLYNLYGPTEATIDATFWRCEAADAGRTVPIGRPVGGARALVLDRHLAPVPIGVVGELYLGGVGLARGYLDRPRETALSFVPDPHGDEPGGRLYRTGDRARRLPGGALELVGRADDQVKIRGHRVELGEIEARLAGHEAVLEAAVAAREDGPGGLRLCAYVVPRAGATASPETLRAHLARALPAVMVPSAFVELPALPRTASGKVDRRALPAPGPQRGAAALPRDPMELRLARIWERVLGVEGVGPGDDFFALGGHSLLALRLLAAIRAELGRDLPAAAIFQAPTVEQLAALLRREGAREGAAAAPSPLLTLSPGGAKRPFFCVHPVGGSALVYLALARRLDPARPFHGLTAPELEGGGEPLREIPALSARYVEAIRQVSPRGPYLLGGFSLGGVIALEMAQVLRRAGEEVAALVLIDSAAPGAPAAPPDPVDFLLDLARGAGVQPPAIEPPGAGGGDGVWRQVVGLARGLGLLPAEGAEERLARWYRVYEANLAAAAAYRPARYPGPVAMIAGAGGADLAAGWRDLIEGPLSCAEIGGDHHELLSGPRLGALAERLRRVLDESDGGELATTRAGHAAARSAEA